MKALAVCQIDPLSFGFWWLLPFRPRCSASRRYMRALSRTSWAVRSASPSRRASATTRVSLPMASPHTSEYLWWGWLQERALGHSALPRSAEAGWDAFSGGEGMFGVGLVGFGLCFYSFNKVVLALDIGKCAKFSVALYHVGWYFLLFFFCSFQNLFAN